MIRSSVAVACVFAVMFVISGCTPKTTHQEAPRELQTFTPVAIAMAKVDEKDYSELVAAVNAGYSADRMEFSDARLLREEGMFLYFHVYSGVSTACFRVTVDRNRSKIINMQPDCAIEE